MSTPFGGLRYIVRKKTNDNVVAVGMTNTDGKFVCNLPPADYVVGVEKPNGYSINSSTVEVPGENIVEPGVSNVQDILVIDVDIEVIDDGTTEIVNNFISD